MHGLAHPAQQPSIALVAGTHVARARAFLQQRLQVVQHDERSCFPQILQQQAQASVEAGRHIGEWLWCEHLEAVRQQRFAGGGIAQRAPDHHLEALGHLVHQANDQRRLANAAHAQHAHHPAALLEHPPGQQRHFPLAPIEGRHRERVAPIDSRSASRLSHGLVTGTSLLDRLRRRERRRGTLLGKQLCEPQFIQQNLLMGRFPECADLLGLAPGGKGLLLYPQRDETFEVVGFGISAASLPIRHRAS